MICLIDNYDSFTYNLYQYLGEMCPDIRVIRNDKITIDEIKAMKPDHIVISPGPGRPEDAGICVDLIRELSGKIPILGICLGHQAMGLAFGGTIDYAPEIIHGKRWQVKNTKKGILQDLGEAFEAGRYHSLCVARVNLPDVLEPLAETEDGVLMAMRHKGHPTFGLQFHPESILTPHGKRILKRFLEEKGGGGEYSMKDYLEQLLRKEDLTIDQSTAMMNSIMSGEYTHAQMAALLTAMRAKGETPDEVTGCALVMRDKAARVNAGDNAIDTCGTGGDGGGTFNVSTTAAFVLAAAGVPVAKHGNRSVSSKCGSADVLEALGVQVALSPEGVESCIREAGIGFMFAPAYHSAMKHVMPVRKELGVKTIFNILGPLTNPAFARYQVIGVFDERLLPMFAHALKNMGTKRALIVHGMDGMDEITLCNKTKVCELTENGEIEEYTISPEDFGLSTCDSSALLGGDAEENAQIIEALLDGKTGPKQDVVCLNAGAALYVTGKVDSIQDGVALAKELLENGKAKAALEAMKKVSQGAVS
ncbi:MAG: bifunctional anthranilate synthase component II/anthranilate phosphoribosyltransferase [Eubacteriales bacterium]